jgi:hypothetical protein
MLIEMFAQDAKQISSEISEILGYKDCCARTHDNLVHFLEWTGPSHPEFPEKISLNKYVIHINRFVYDKEYTGVDGSMNHEQETVELKRFLTPTTSSAHLIESLYADLARSAKHHVFDYSWLAAFAGQDPLIIDTVCESPMKLGIIAKRTTYYLNDSTETLSVQPLIIIPGAGKEVNQALRNWEGRFLVDSYVLPNGNLLRKD